MHDSHPPVVPSEPNPPPVADEFAIPGVGSPSGPDRESPSEWRSWMGSAVYHSAPFLLASRAAEPDGIRRRMVHAVVSYPPDYFGRAGGVRSAFPEAVHVARDHGVRSGLVVFHGFRLHPDIESIYEDETGEPVPSPIDLWNWTRERDGDWREVTAWGPHFHVVGLAEDVEPNDAGDGPLFSNIRSLAPFHIDDTEAYIDTKTVMFDLFNHPTFRPGTDDPVVRWFGGLRGDDPETPARLVDDETWDRLMDVYFAT